MHIVKTKLDPDSIKSFEINLVGLIWIENNKINYNKKWFSFQHIPISDVQAVGYEKLDHYNSIISFIAKMV